jgi:insertion element IS1 protein InsB
MGTGSQTANGGDGAQWQRHPRHCPGAGSQPDDGDDYPQKKAPALHPVNPILVTAGKGALPAVVVHKVKEAELDEMWSFVGSKKHPQWLWEALDHQTGRIVAYTFGRRADQALVKLKGLLAPLGIRRFYTDGWGAYRRHLDPKLHVIGKRRTQQLERKHLTLRTRIKRLVRRTICFSKSLQMHEIVIGLFINRFEFGVNV